MRRLLVTGSLAYDYILEYPGRLQDALGRIHTDDGSRISFHTSKMERHYGGCGGNVSYTLGLLGESPRLIAIAGVDTDDYMEHLRAVGVDCSRVRHECNERTATCLIINDEAQNRFVAFHGGVVDRAGELSIIDSVDSEVVGCIITPDDVPAMVKFAAECKKLDLPFYFDFGSQVTWLSPDQLRTSLPGARAAFCNEYEFSMFGKKTGWSLNDILEQVPVMVITRGAEGCDLYQADDEPVHIPACPLKENCTLDPSGAGDAFRAGFGFGRVRGWPWKLSAQLASTAAAFALEAHGTQGHKFHKGLLLERCQQVYGPLPADLLSTV